MRNKLYLAYGSNLNLEQMANRCPTAKVVGNSKINGYEKDCVINDYMRFYYRDKR